MNTDLLLTAVLAGAATYALRVLPVLWLTRAQPEGALARLLAATGPAAIATLLVASLMPQLYPVPRDVVPLVAGTVGTVVAFLPRRSVVAATLVGAAAYGMAFALI